jgi:hypothetical protein
MGPSLEHVSDPLYLVVGALAVYRLTRLVVADVLLDGPRARLSARSDRWAVFITCPWCVSVWLAAGWVLLLGLLPVVALVAGVILAWSAVAGLLSSME